MTSWHMKNGNPSKNSIFDRYLMKKVAHFGPPLLFQNPRSLNLIASEKQVSKMTFLGGYISEASFKM